MTRQSVRNSARRACVGAGALMAVLIVPVLAVTSPPGPAATAPVGLAAVTGGFVPADSGDDSNSGDSNSGDSHTLRNTKCDPGYPEGVCVQSPTQSENNTTSES